MGGEGPRAHRRFGRDGVRLSRKEGGKRRAGPGRSDAAPEGRAGDGGALQGAEAPAPSPPWAPRRLRAVGPTAELHPHGIPSTQRGGPRPPTRSAHWPGLPKAARRPQTLLLASRGARGGGMTMRRSRAWAGGSQTLTCRFTHACPVGANGHSICPSTPFSPSHKPLCALGLWKWQAMSPEQADSRTRSARETNLAFPVGEHPRVWGETGVGVGKARASSPGLTSRWQKPRVLQDQVRNQIWKSCPLGHQPATLEKKLSRGVRLRISSTHGFPPIPPPLAPARSSSILKSLGSA